MFSHDRKRRPGRRASRRSPWASRSPSPAAPSGGGGGSTEGGDGGGDANLAITFLPKNLGNPYFDTSDAAAARRPSRSSAAPTPRSARPRPARPRRSATSRPRPSRASGGLVVSANDPEAICDALNEARDAGVKVVTFDSDTNPECRDLFINQATAEGIAKVAGRPDRRADRRRRPDRDPVGIRQRDEPERLDRDDGGGPRREPPRTSSSSRRSTATTTTRRRSTRPRRCCRPTPS